MSPNPLALVNAARRHEWQVAWWSVFALAFVFVGAVPLENIHRQTRVADHSAMNSTDVAFAQTIGVTAQRIAEIVRDLPQDRPIAIVFSDNALLLLAVSQLSALCWPRPAPLLCVPTRGDSQLAERLYAARPVAAFFVSTEIPAGIPRGEAVSPELHFVLLP